MNARIDHMNSTLQSTLSLEVTLSSSTGENLSFDDEGRVAPLVGYFERFVGGMSWFREGSRNLVLRRRSGSARRAGGLERRTDLVEEIHGEVFVDGQMSTLRSEVELFRASVSLSEAMAVRRTLGSAFLRKANMSNGEEGSRAA